MKRIEELVGERKEKKRDKNSEFNKIKRMIYKKFL
jgi:hypothetical protein